MKRRLGAALLAGTLAGSGCAAQLHHDVHVERGELLREYERQSLHPAAGVSVELTARYPNLEARFQSYDGCRVEHIEEYPQTRIDEISNPAAGPSLATGICTAAIGAGLLAFSPLFGTSPNTHVIDASGHYGPPPRQGAQIGGWVGVGIGVPSLAVALVGYLQTSTQVTRTVTEETVRAQETPCHHAPLDGDVVLTGRALDAPPLHTQGGALTVTAEQMRAMPFDGFIVAGRNVLLTPAQEEMLASFDACAHLLAGPGEATPVAKLGRRALLERRTLALACDRLPDAPATALLREVEKTLGLASAAPAVGGPQSFDEAVQKLAPRLTLAEDSPDLAHFSVGDEAPATPVRVRGILSQRLTPELVVLEVGGLKLLAALPEESAAPFDTDLPLGTRVEVVGTWLAPPSVPLAHAPQLSVTWMRRTAGGAAGPTEPLPGTP